MAIRQKLGFTLLEMLIALAIFSVVSMTAGSLLYQAVEAQSVSTRLGDRLMDMERGLGRLSRDVSQYVSREVRDEFGEANPALLLNPHSMEFTRRGWANPAEHPRSDLQRVRYWVEDDVLRRAYWDVLDRSPESAPKVQTLIEGVSWATFEAITASQVLSGDPDPYAGEQEEEPPIGLRIVLQVHGYGEMVRIIDLPVPPSETGDSDPGTSLESEANNTDEVQDESQNG